MPSDLQIIDGFERLREQFVAENPAVLPSAALAKPDRPPAPRSETDSVESRIVEAWLQAVDGRPTRSAPQQRRIRALARAILEPERAADPPGPEDERLVELGRSIPRRLKGAKGRNGWPWTTGAGPKSAAEEIRAWSGVLPAMGGLRPWRFLERMGRAVIVPDAPARRFLWRIGLMEEAPDGAGAMVLTQSIVERVAGLTGLEVPMLATLIQWHVRGASEWVGGGVCGRRPRCAVCPFRAGCVWARFHPEQPGEQAAERRPLEPLNREMAAGKQDRLDEVELLAVLLQGGVAGAGALDLAEALLRRFNGLRGLDRATVEQLSEARGISRGRAIQLKAALELGRRLAEQVLEPSAPITCSNDVWRAYRARFRNLPQEHFVVILMDAKNRVIHDHIVSKGTLTGSLAHPREVFGEAIRHAAAGVIVLHNHPSGDPQPSRDDREITARLKEAGDVLGIRLLDHLILGADDYYSFKDEGEL